MLGGGAQMEKIRHLFDWEKQIWINTEQILSWLINTAGVVANFTLI